MYGLETIMTIEHKFNVPVTAYCNDGSFSKKLCGPEKGRLVMSTTYPCSLLAAGVLGDSFGSFRDSMLGQFTWQEKADCSLDFSAGDG